ncbi:MAG: hypothetical protein E6R04_07905 [Spirochaetes bacterium]|nr:MAG: hypothetical protein E6R04_07905 [Spirochaetota bacterium]
MIDQEPTEDEKVLVGKLIRFKSEDSVFVNTTVVRISIQEEPKMGSRSPRTWLGGKHAKPVGKTQTEAIKTFTKQTTLLIVDLTVLSECETLYVVVDNESGSLYLTTRDSFDLLQDTDKDLGTCP